MRKVIIPALAAIALLVAAGPASAATVPVTSLSGQFDGTNSSVVLTADGVQFGPYANGGTAGGSVYYSGANGLTLGDIAALAYTIEYNTSNDTTVGVPYLRVFLEGDTHDVIFSPKTQVAPRTAENTTVTHNVVGGTVRYDDDPGAGSERPWTTVKAAHASEVVSGIYVSTGFSAGTDLSALQTDLTVNGTTFCFDCNASVRGTGTAGTPNGADGTTGKPGVNGAPGSGQAKRCTGAALRALRSPSRTGEKFLSVRATLRGKKLKANGRRVTVDLRGQREGNYNVRFTSRYRRAGGKARTVKTTRNLSVVCA